MAPTDDSQTRCVVGRFRRSAPRGRPAPEPDWSLGCSKLVPARDVVEGCQGYEEVGRKEVPFRVAFELAMADDPGPARSGGSWPSAPMPRALFDAALDYDRWMADGAKGAAPELAQAAESMCAARLAWSLGLGGSIWFESAADARALAELFG